MKLRLCGIAALLLTLFTTQSEAQLNAWHAAVQLNAVVTGPTSIELQWDPTISPEGTIHVWRRVPVATGLGEYLGETPASSGSFAVEDADLSQVEEYVAQRVFKVNDQDRAGLGYITVGRELPAVDNRGRIILLVDASVADELESEIERLKRDLIGDGWQVVRHDVARDAAVPDVQKTVIDTWQENQAETKAVYILGHVPVPYSGHTAPDGHLDHIGAWPADCFYADMNGFWTDNFFDQDSARRDQNDNLIGDGKYDQSFFPSTLELAVGRVDMANMPAFEKSEVELLRQYLDRAHAWRFKEFTVQTRALIDDNFGFFGGEAFASSAYRSYAPLVGRENIYNNVSSEILIDYMPVLREDDYLWSYGCGGGSYRSAGGIGDTDGFAQGHFKTVFTMLFGSYFGDWDASNNFLRAPLAADGYCLMNAWSGRPHWHMHFMALGATTGESTLRSQNNGNSITTYYAAGNNRLGITMALMGDPSIRMHVAAPVNNLSATAGDNVVGLNWDAPVDEDVAFYNVYRSSEADGPFMRINDEGITATSYNDATAQNGTNYYMVRAAVLQESPSGSYYNQSQGVFVDAEFERTSTSVAEATELPDFRVGPNPAVNYVDVNFGLTESENFALRLIDVRGATAYNAELGTVSGNVNHRVPMDNLPAGMYIIELNVGEKIYHTRVVRQD